MAARVLVVEDDHAIGAGLQRALTPEGYDVAWAQTGADALRAATSLPPDLVLLDLVLPDIDGIDVCSRLRQRHPSASIVVLTARGEEIDIVVGLDAGADDYITKPFRLAELLARVRAHLRRTAPGTTGQRLKLGPLEIDLGARRVEISGDEIELRPKEFDLLALLAGEAGQVLTRERIMEEVWDEHWFGSTKTLDMHISSLRRKLTTRAAGLAECIATLRGVGYRFDAP